MKSFRAKLVADVGEEIERDQIRGFARSVAEIEWLILILVLLYLLAPGTQGVDNPLVAGSLITFLVFILVFRYLNFYRPQTRLKISFETLAMIGFITAMLIPTGGQESPLLNLYLLPIIVAALTLGKWTTLLFVALISVCYIFVGTDLEAAMSLTGFSEILANLAPFLLVAFITTMLANDIDLAKNRIRALSETDELTGLYNMRAFTRLHKREHDKAVRYSRSYGLMLLDMDDLKRVNDDFGHEAGSHAIVLVANVITRLIRNTDVAARYGGDEFIILLSEISPTRLDEIGKRIRSSVQNATLDYEGQMFRTSVSIGSAVFPTDGTDPRDLIRNADGLMYKNKELRRRPPLNSPAKRS
ncbi:MAG: diguanylate cyclase [Gammaproteobacteria bacterium]